MWLPHLLINISFPWEEVGPRVVRTFQLWKKTESQTWGRNALKKNRVLTFCGLCFFLELEKNKVHKKWGLCFFTAFPPNVWDSVFFQSWNVRTTVGKMSSCLMEPGFWILTKGVKRQLVRGQTRPNSNQVLGWSKLLFSLLPFCLGLLVFLFTLLPSCTIVLHTLCPLA